MENATQKHDMTAVLRCQQCKQHTMMVYLTGTGSYCSKDCFWSNTLAHEALDVTPSPSSRGTRPTQQHALRAGKRVCSDNHPFPYGLFRVA